MKAALVAVLAVATVFGAALLVASAIGPVQGMMAGGGMGGTTGPGVHGGMGAGMHGDMSPHMADGHMGGMPSTCPCCTAGDV